MALIKNPMCGGGSGGGSIEIVNGLIKQYKASAGVISANTFVEFVADGALNVSASEQIDSTATVQSGNDYYPTVVKLDDEHVFVAYVTNTSGSTNDVYGRVIEIDQSNNEINPGPQTLIASIMSQPMFDLEALSASSVLFSFRGVTDNALSCAVLSISGTTITTGTETVLAGAPQGLYVRTAMLTNGNVFIQHAYDSTSTYLYGMSVSISGNTITIAAPNTAIDTNYTNTGKGISRCKPVLLPDGRIVIFYVRDTHPYCMTLIIGSTITKNSAYQISTVDSVQSATTIVMNQEDIFFGFSSTRGYESYGSIISVSASAVITAGTSVLLASQPYDDSSNQGNQLWGLSRITEEYLLGFYSLSNTRAIGYLPIWIQGTTVTIETLARSTIAGYGPEIVPLSSSDTFMFYRGTANSSTGISAALIDQSEVIRAQTATNPDSIQGLTADAITDQSSGGVWVLDTSQSE
ncbi:hypothetical protein IJH02_03265 [Candidatus Saccharibacteria bacterium]|nr:hypothetical protein [Candidatus Saccharibacteria bacterium]